MNHSDYLFLVFLLFFILGKQCTFLEWAARVAAALFLAWIFSV